MATIVSFQRLKRRALSLGAANGFDYLAQFLLPVVLVRYLDAETFGEYRLLWLLVGTVMAFATLNMPESLYYFLPRSAPREKRIYIAQSLVFVAATGLLAAWALSPLNPWLPAAVAPLTAYGGLVPAFVLLWLTAYLLDFLPAVDERVRWQAGFTIGMTLLRVGLLAAGAVLSADMGVLLALLLAFVTLKLAALLAYIAAVHGLARPWFHSRQFVEQFRHAAPIGAANGLFTLRLQADQWVAAHLFSLGQFAAFSIAAVLSPLVNLFRHSVYEAFLPSMSRLQASGDIRGMLELNGRANVMIGALLYPLLAFVFVFAEELITIVYTENYVEAAPVMRLYTAALACMVVEVGSIVLLMRQGVFAIKVNALTLVASIGISWAGALHFGLAGAAAGSVLAVYLDRAAILWRVSRCSGVAFRDIQHWRGLAAAVVFAAAAGLCAWGAAQWWLADAAPLPRLLAGGVVLVAAYLLLSASSRLRRFFA